MPSKYKGDKETLSALDTFIALSRCYNSLCLRTNRHLAAAGVGLSEFAVLEAILHLGPLAQSEIAKKILCSKANLTLTIDKLETRGWVARDRQTDDRRTVLVALTKQGRAQIRTMFKKHAEVLRQEMSVLTVSEQLVLKQLSKRLGMGLEAQ